MSAAAVMNAPPAAGPRCTFCGRVGHLHTWHDPAIRQLPCARCEQKGHVSYNEVVHPPARTMAQIRAAAPPAPLASSALAAATVVAIERPAGPRARACSICGELGHRADNPRHRGEVATPAPPAPLPSALADVKPRSAPPSPCAPSEPAMRRSHLPALATAAAAPAHPWRDLSPATSPPEARWPAKRCSTCGSSEHRANNKVAHPPPVDAASAEDAPPAPAERPRWTPADDGDEGSITLERARAKAEMGADGRQHAATLAQNASWAERRSLSLAVLQDDHPDIPRPRTRGDCGHVLRPCPFVSCSQHLYLDVNEETGSLKLNFPHLEPWELRESCAMDVAEKGGVTLEEVAQLANLTRERIRQIEFRSIRKLRQRAPELAEPSTWTAEAACSGEVL